MQELLQLSRIYRVIDPMQLDQGSFPADVTAGKMGVTKTVSAMLPLKGFEPLAGKLKQLKEMNDTSSKGQNDDKNEGKSVKAKVSGASRARRARTSLLSVSVL